MRFDFRRPAIAGSASDRDLKQISAEELSAIDLIELRVDHFSDLSEGCIQGVFREARSLGKPVIATVRSTDEGGRRRIPDAERVRIFRLVKDLADLMDIEARAEIFDEVRDVARAAGTPLIASYHNFNGTPSYDVLSAHVARCLERGADIVKIATTTNTEHDLRTMTRITLDHLEKGLVTVCMGPKGLISRVFFPVVGSLFTFASIGDSKAPGQVPVAELRRFMDRLAG